jgi:hypothetical protein
MATHVKTGLWIDKSQSNVLGATITLPVRWSNILVSVLTVAVTIIASCFWTIGAFLLHQYTIRRQNVDVVHLQHQVILRNSVSPLFSLWEVMKVQSAWKRRRVVGLKRRSLLVGLPALLIWTIFTIASIFVSEVASKSYSQIPVLLVPDDCGYFSWNGLTQPELGERRVKTTKDTIAARAYAGNWYSNSSTQSSASSIFPVNTLPYTIQPNASCPFDASRCALGPSSGFSLTTDLLDSHSMFGINAPVSDRIGLQINVTCTVVHVADLIKEVANAEGWVEQDFYLGPTDVTDYTFSYLEISAYMGMSYMIRYIPLHSHHMFNT